VLDDVFIRGDLDQYEYGDEIGDVESKYKAKRAMNREKSRRKKKNKTKNQDGDEVESVMFGAADTI